MKRPLVSVALPTYNGERFLGEQLASIRAQTWPALEIVVSDDRSTDRTPEILAEEAERHGLRYSVAPRRLGVLRNFERAISGCRGDLITLCDQDDLWKPERVERLVEGLEPGFSLSYCKPEEYLDESGRLRTDHAYAPIREWSRRHGNGRVTESLLAENWVVSHGMLFTPEVTRRALPIPAHQPQHDGWIALVASTVGDGIHFVDESLMIYRRHPDSYTYRGQDPGPGERPGTAPLARFGAAWRSRCRAEIARIEDALGLPLDEDARRFAHDLLRYYRSGLSGSLDPSAFRIGWRMAPRVSTLYPRRGRWRPALKGLIGGALAALVPQAAAARGTEEAP